MQSQHNIIVLTTAKSHMTQATNVLNTGPYNAILTFIMQADSNLDLSQIWQKDLSLTEG